MDALKAMQVCFQLQRDLQEYRTSLLLTPFLVAGLLVLLMLGSVIVADRVSIVGDGVMQVLLREDAGAGLSISINLDDDNSPRSYTVIEASGEIDEAEWNFSHEWTFRPGRSGGGAGDVLAEEHLDSLNPVLNILHVLFLFLLMIVSVNYALNCLYQDRKDRSILFWKSLPVSEWQEVLCKLLVVTLLAPLAYLAASILTQLAYALLAMLLVWSLDAGESSVVLDNIQFVPLFSNQISGLLIWTLWTLPVYAWLLVASAAARRSPFMFAFGIPVALILVEKVFIGSNVLAAVIFNYLPHLVGEDDSAAMGMYMNGPVWSYPGMMLGFAVTAVFAAVAVWLRRHRFEM